MRKLTVIISYYKNPEALRLILKSLNNQSVNDFEVIVSEDDNNQETTALIQNILPELSFELTHIRQEKDLGFRKNEMLNRGIKTAKGEFIVFIDGDCIPHKHLIKQYISRAKKGFILQGRRVNLGEKISNKLLDSGALSLTPFFHLLFSSSKKIKEGIYFPLLSLSPKKKGLLGCNWGIYKNHLCDINGFDEDYTNAGVGEDTDIEWRLKGMGLKTISMKNRAIVYHLYHAKSYSQEMVKKGYALFQKKKIKNHIRCLNGLEKISISGN